MDADGGLLAIDLRVTVKLYTAIYMGDTAIYIFIWGIYMAVDGLQPPLSNIDQPFLVEPGLMPVVTW